MAGGGQRGLSIIGEAGLAFGLLGFIGGCQVRGWVDSPPKGAAEVQASFETECAQADADRRSGAEEVNAVILADPKCQGFLMWQEAEEQMDRADQMREQTEQVQEAQTP